MDCLLDTKILLILHLVLEILSPEWSFGAYPDLSGPVKVPAEFDKEIFIIVRGVAQPG